MEESTWLGYRYWKSASQHQYVRERVHVCDFSFLRQKRSMGLTLAEAELNRLDVRVRDRVALERERSCSEHIISKINEVL